MAASFELTMQPREQLGTAASRRLRRIEKKVPVILYGKDKPSIALSVEHSVLDRLTEEDAVYSSVLTIKTAQGSYSAILKDLQRDPVKPSILSADFLLVDESNSVHLTIPLQFSGEQVAPGVKQGGGIVSYQMNSVEVHSLPKHIPEAIVVDISKLEAGEHISLSQLELPEGVTLAHKEDRIIVTIIAPRGQSSASKTEEEATSTAE